MSRETILTDWSAAVSAFNGGDVAPMRALFAAGATHATERGTLPVTGPDIVTKLYDPARAASGWRQQILSLAAEGEFLTSLYRNQFADGTAALGCGICRLDADGKILEVRSWEQSDVRTPLSPPAH